MMRRRRLRLVVTALARLFVFVLENQVPVDPAALWPHHGAFR